MKSQVTIRLVNLLVALLLTLNSTLVAHAAGKSVPSQATANSTKLAWFYKPPADGNITLVAENFSTYIMTKGNEATRDQFINLGAPQSPVLEYLRFEAIMDPGSCTAKPWQNNVAYMVGDFCSISAEHPDWFLLNTAGQRIVHVYATTSFYLMDPGNPGWRAFFLQRVSQIFAADPVWDGVFLDNVEVTNAFHVAAGENLAAYPDNASFQAAVQGFLQYLHESFFQPQGKVLYANLISRTDDALFTSYMTSLDGAMHEGWAIDDPNRWRSVTTWEKHMNLVEQSEAMGKPLILVSHGTQIDLELQQFAYASYLLVADGLTSFRYGSDSAYTQAWLYDNYRLQLGTPLGARYKVGSAWHRDFSNGSVSVDPGTHAVSINLLSGPTAIPTQIVPTATRVPATATLIPATATPLPPTATKVPATATKIVATATKTKIPATATAVKATATKTKIPATATRLVPTATRILPTATKLPATATQIAPIPTQATTYENTSTAFIYSTGWTTVSDSKASSGSYAKSNTLHSSITLFFTGSSFKLAFLTQPLGGNLQVWVDGRLYYTISQKASATSYIRTWRLAAADTLSLGQHTLTLIFDNPAGTVTTLDRVTIY